MGVGKPEGRPTTTGGPPLTESDVYRIYARAMRLTLNAAMIS